MLIITLAFVKQIVKLSLFFNGISWDGTDCTSLCPAQQMVANIGHQNSADFLWWLQMMIKNGTEMRKFFDIMLEQIKAEVDQFNKNCEEIVEKWAQKHKKSRTATNSSASLASCQNFGQNVPTLQSYYVYYQLFRHLNTIRAAQTVN
ncbi:hypothetical protein niasHS_002921 [Heterodera schachtii]|uniref:Uncharacterized protein n=1 Tax=Heterodera schachtii TaxID=97005 RepID=A0ABD2K9A6_HETSC